MQDGGMIDISQLDPKIQGQLAAGVRPSDSDIQRIVRAIAAYIESKSDRPGEDGLISQVCEKLVCAYPCLASSGSKISEKTVIF